MEQPNLSVLQSVCGLRTMLILITGKSFKRNPFQYHPPLVDEAAIMMLSKDF